MVLKREVEVALVVVLRVMLSKMLLPEKVLLFERSVEEAAVMVMLAVPSKEVPLMVRGVWSWVAVPALPETAPVMVLEKVLLPEKVLLFERSVEEAAVMVMSEVPLKEVPLMFLAVWRAVAVEALPVRAPVTLPKIPPEAVRTPVMVVEALMVEEAVERKPFRKPRVVEVETP